MCNGFVFGLPFIVGSPLRAVRAHPYPAPPQALSNAASIVVVLVNFLLEKLAGFLGSFERHETMSGMRRGKVNVLTISQTLNIGFVNLIVSMAASPSMLNSIRNDGWLCWRRGEGGGLCGSTEFCCVLGPTGLLLRGSYLTMDGPWHQEVGALIAYTMMLQCATAAAAPLGPALQHWYNKRGWRQQITLV